MDVEIAISPDLQVTPETFAKAWNGDPQCREIASAEVRQKGGTQYEPITLMAVLAGVAGSVAASVISHFIIKALDDKKPAASRLEVKETRRADGSRIFVVTSSGG
jgi:hypothetical protein